ncbi:MAG TPA: aspartate/glutamate racemase family protein, partial [Thermoanaerobaculia bacterium]|nr:aspartate/glutamate racemase family protein [Thermoanaerobaculia bacterium]
MSHLRRMLAVFTLAFLPLAGCATSTKKPASFAEAVKARSDVTIVVTDSGLGGLSVAADLASRLPASGIAKSARIVFVNALLDDAIGYNDLKDEADKVRVFDAALAAMESRYHPDLVLVACNTLSVFYDKTEHARRGTTETVSIVPMGADLIERTLRATPDSTAMIFATKGTIDSGAHRRLLLAKGVPDEKIVGQACPKLTGAIERGAHSEETVGRIRGFVEEAIARLPEKKGPLVASLNCTHFGYARPLWEETFASLGFPGVKVLDPNPLMTDLVLREGAPRRYPETKVTVEVVSKTPITPGVKAALGALLRTTSPATADALDHYTHAPDLFHVAIEP